MTCYRMGVAQACRNIKHFAHTTSSLNVQLLFFRESWQTEYPLTVLIGRLIILLWPTLLLYHAIRIIMSFAFMISLNLL